MRTGIAIRVNAIHTVRASLPVALASLLPPNGSRRARGAVPITITERDGVCSIMTGKTTTGTAAARWWIRSWGSGPSQ